MNTNIHKIPSKKQSGIVLPIALILLLISTLIGVSSLRGNVISEKMARNTIQRDIAFNKAETALLEAEQLVDDNASAIKGAIFGVNAADDCSATFIIDGNSTKGFCSPASNPQDSSTTDLTTERWLIPNLFTDTNDRYVTSDNGSKYIVEFMGHILNSSNGTSCLMGAPTTWPYCETDAMQFRLTVLAEGDVAGESRVVLQSTYVVAP